MKFEQGYRITMGGALRASALCARGQVLAPHSPTLSAATVPANPAVVTKPAVATKPAPASAGNAVAKVNGAVLTDRDLMREIQTIFPYAKLHHGVPKSMEPDVRKGALEIIIFEELV